MSDKDQTAARVVMSEAPASRESLSDGGWRDEPLTLKSIRKGLRAIEDAQQDTQGDLLRALQGLELVLREVAGSTAAQGRQLDDLSLTIRTTAREVHDLRGAVHRMSKVELELHAIKDLLQDIFDRLPEPALTTEG